MGIDEKLDDESKAGRDADLGPRSYRDFPQGAAKAFLDPINKVHQAPPITRELDRMQVLLGKLEMSLGEHSATIEPLLGPAYSDGGVRDTEPVPDVSVMADSLKQFNDRLNKHIELLRSMTERIEL